MVLPKDYGSVNFISFKKEIYMAFDESSPFKMNRGIIIAAAVTSNPNLIELKPFGTYKKAADYIKNGKLYSIECYDDRKIIKFNGDPSFPKLSDMIMRGLDNYHYIKSDSHRFCRPFFESLSIAELIMNSTDINGEPYDPKYLKLIVDAYTNPNSLEQQIYNTLNEFGFKININNITACQGADKSIQLATMADNLAFRISLASSPDFQVPKDNDENKLKIIIPESFNIKLYESHKIDAISNEKRKFLTKIYSDELRPKYALQ